MDHSETSTLERDILPRLQARASHPVLAEQVNPEGWESKVCWTVSQWLCHEAGTRTPEGASRYLISYRLSAWSDDGESTSTFIPSRRVEGDMRRGALADADMISDEELTELLADIEGMTPEEIEHGAAELEIAPPEEATVVDE